MPLNIEIEVQDCENLTLEIIDAPFSDSVSIDDSAGIGDTDVTWSADKSARELADKVDKEVGKSLVFDTEIEKLSTVEQYATANRPDAQNADKVHTHVISDVTGLDTALETKVDKVTGKGLSDTNFTQAEKTKLSGIAYEATKNRDDSENADKIHGHVIADVAGLDDALADKVDAEVGMGLSELSFTTVDKLSLDQSEQDRHTHNNKPVIDGLSDDAGVLQYKGLPISDQAALDAKVDKVAGYSLVDDSEIAKLATVQENATANRDDSENADKVHDHTVSQVVGLSDRLDSIDALIGDVESVLIAINGEP